MKRNYSDWNLDSYRAYVVRRYGEVIAQAYSNPFEIAWEARCHLSALAARLGTDLQTAASQIRREVAA